MAVGSEAPLSPAQRARIRRLSQPKELAPDEEGGELNIVPFLDIIVNILIFVLATVAVTFTASMEVSPPASRGSGVRPDTDTTSLSLKVWIVKDGFSLKSAGGNVAPGCEGLGPGIAIPKKGDKYDYVELNRCGARLKESNPDFEAETQFTITANADVSYEVVTSVMDALRKTQRGKPLFSHVSFGVPR